MKLTKFERISVTAGLLLAVIALAVFLSLQALRTAEQLAFERLYRRTFLKKLPLEKLHQGRGLLRPNPGPADTRTVAFGLSEISAGLYNIERELSDIQSSIGARYSLRQVWH